MSDVSKTNEALIAEARKAERAVYLATEEAVAKDISRIIKGLADALEAKTGVRVDMSSAVGVETQLAATRVPAIDSAMIDRFKTGWNAADNMDLFGGRVHAGLVAALESATRVPEQGEASAAIERVRAIHLGTPRLDIWRRREIGGSECTECQGAWPCATTTALDGAPEPEQPLVHFEYGYGWMKGRKELALSRYDAIGQASIRPHDCRVFKRVQKRKGKWPAGPWLPVEGKSE